jgi:hypothetical protein
MDSSDSDRTARHSCIRSLASREFRSTGPAINSIALHLKPPSRSATIIMSETILVIIFGSLASVLALVDIFFAFLHYKLATSKSLEYQGRV